MLVSNSPLVSWLHLEQRFRTLAEDQSLIGLRLDFQWGSSGEHWNLTGTNRGVRYNEVVAVSTIAGKLLSLSELDKSGRYETVLIENKPLERWFHAVKEFGGTFQSQLPAKEINADGTMRGYIHHGSASSYCSASANLCLELASIAPIRDPRSWRARIFEEYGREIVIGSFIALVTAIVGVAFG